MNTTLFDFKNQQAAYDAAHKVEVDRLTAEQDDAGFRHPDKFLGILDDIAGALGADAANLCSDVSEEDEAIDACENWIVENVSNADTRARVLAILTSYGVEAGTQRIHDALVA